MRARHLSATFSLLVLQSCRSEPTAETLSIAAHYAPLCTPASDHSGSRTIEVRALGDFDPSNSTVAFLDEAAREQPLQIPEQTAEIELRSVGPKALWAIAPVQDQDTTDALLLPALEACPLFDSSSASARLDAGSAVGVSAGRWLFAAGADELTSARRARLLDLATGTDVNLGSTRMTRARAFGTATPFLGGFLIAGGQDPASGTAHDDAEIFDLKTRQFSGSTSLIALSEARTKHAALSLSSSSVLLVGGADSDGTALDSLEVVTSRGSEPAPLAHLAQARIEPTVLLLDDDRIVVAGGYTVADTAQAPVGLIEWINGDASARVDSLSLDPPALGRAFVATVGGGVLATGGCDMGGAFSPSVWWIDRQLQATRLPDLPTAAQSCRPQLISATVGQPFLLSNGALWRFNPWSGQFEASSVAVDATPGGELMRATAIDAGLFSWLDVSADASRLLALRHDTRNAYSADVTPFLLTDNTRLAPSGAATADSYARYADDQRLEMLGSSAEIWITDTTYADLELELKVESGPAPVVLLGTQAFGTGSCAWPTPAPADGRYQLRRRGSTVELDSGSTQHSCSLRTAHRVPLGLRGRSSANRIAELTVSRGGEP